ncbi:hypothetical protein HRE72_13440 [Enterococcus faecalis]|nr:hypothetical protein [Enterococcus faecalis]
MNALTPKQQKCKHVFEKEVLHGMKTGDYVCKHCKLETSDQKKYMDTSQK